MSSLSRESKEKVLEEKDQAESLEAHSKAHLDDKGGASEGQTSPAVTSPAQVLDRPDPQHMYQHDQRLSFDTHNMMSTLTEADPLHSVPQGGQSWSTSPGFVSPPYQGIHPGSIQGHMPPHLPNQHVASSPHIRTPYYQPTHFYGVQPPYGIGTAPQSSTQPYGHIYSQQYPPFQSHQPPAYGHEMIGSYPVGPSFGREPWSQTMSNQYGHMNQVPPIVSRPYPLQNDVFPSRLPRIAIPQRPHNSKSTTNALDIDIDLLLTSSRREQTRI